MKHLISLTIAIFVILSVNAQEKVQFKFENGQIQKEGYLDKDNNKNGEWKTYLEDGSLWTIVKYDKGNIIGKIVYADAEWEDTSKENCKYYRVITKQNDGYYKCNDFWITGELQMVGKFRDLNLDIKEGEFVWYHKNGEIKIIANYENGKKNGKYKSFNTYGQLISKGNYKDDLRIGTWKNYYKNNTSKSGLTVDDAIDYNDKLIAEELVVIDRINDLDKALTSWNPSEIEPALQAAKDQIDESVNALEDLGGFDGNNEFVESCLELFKVFKSQLNDEYARQFEIIKIYNDTPDFYTKKEENEYNDLNDVLDSEYYPAFDKFSSAQEDFADFWGFHLE